MSVSSTWLLSVYLLVDVLDGIPLSPLLCQAADKSIIGSKLQTAS